MSTGHWAARVATLFLAALLTGCAATASASAPPTATARPPTPPAQPGPNSAATPGEQSSTIRDCGDDLACFIQASAACTTARVTFTTTFEFFGVVPTSTALYEIRGQQGDYCELHSRTLEAGVTFSEATVAQLLASGSTEEEIAASQAEMSQSLQREVGMARTCRLSPEAIAEMFRRWLEGNFSSEDYPPGACTQPAREE